MVEGNMDSDLSEAINRWKGTLRGDPERKMIGDIFKEIRNKGWTVVTVGGLFKDIEQIKENLTRVTLPGKNVKTQKIEQDENGEKLSEPNNPEAYIIYDNRRIAILTVPRGQASTLDKLRKKDWQLKGKNCSHSFNNPELDELIYIREKSEGETLDFDS